MNLKRTILTVLLIAVTAFAFAADGKEQPAASSGPVGIKVAAWDVGTSNFYPSLLEEFKKAYPNINVEMLDNP